jgi:hypothetical protein
MNPKYKITIHSDASGSQLAELSIQTEVKLLLSMAEIDLLTGVFEGFDISNAHSIIKYILNSDSIPEEMRPYFEFPYTDLTSINGRIFDCSDLNLIVEPFSKKFFCRIEGSCPYTRLVIGRSVNFTEIAVNDNSLKLIAKRLEADLQDVSVSAAIKDVIGLVLAAIAVGIDAWRLYREEQDREREQEERERSAQDRKGKEKEQRRNREGVSAGGPASDGLAEKIRQTA